MATNLHQFAKKNGVKYFFVSFVDLFGVLRSKLVPATAIDEIQSEGAGFAGFATWLDMSPADSDMFGIPDGDSVIQLPWNKEIAWVASDLYMDGKPVEASPRVALKAQIAKANKLGMYMKSGVECEYFLVNSDGTALSDPKDTQEKPCYDSSALMRRYDVITEICDSMISMGWKPYQNDHEDANGQFEMNWDFSDCLQTADRHAFFKFMTKTIAEKHGLRATFMPKPFTNLTGNGCHSHISVWDKTGKKNLFLDKKDELGLSKTGYHFLGGIVNSADKMAAIFNPTVNSYKRINGSVTLSGATWSPSSITWAGNNRTHMVRVPGPGRFELRLMDGASNPYLLQAGSLMLGLDGVMNKRDPGKRLDINMYTEGHKAGKVKKLPLNLLDSIRIFDSSKVIREGFGNQFVDSYVKLKNKEWESYSRDLSQWERNTTLDC
ncbi:type III glutamate--ammonia ligase [Alphaproteobacteria bacterium]|jgi:glutamine synthetase|nr:type III glutamate--ammonia ligase [Alphaproteobacteria bacterium]MDB3973315.1 type III glutamate--ammonia ligase [Alphaproteobacteria bacterium]